MKDQFVLKRDGKKEKFDAEKINKYVALATEGIKDVSVSDIVINSHLSTMDNITTVQINDALIASARNLISLETPNYQYVAGKLLNFQLRKNVWGGKTQPQLFDLINKNIKTGHYDPAILNFYSKKEINKLGDYLKHERDMRFTYAGLQQLMDKYLIHNKFTGEIFETPQFAYMLIAMTAFAEYGESKMDYVKLAYDSFSTFKINLPTPVMSGMRSVTRNFASCCLIKSGDTLDSILTSVNAVGKATGDSYGIGLHFGDIRAIGTPVKNGRVKHTGVIPFLKCFESTVKSCQQSARGGSATVYFPIWHYEIEDVIQLKNNAGTDENRVRKLDYAVCLSKIFYQRFLKDEQITLFSPHEVPELKTSFGLPEFDELYLKAEQNPKIKFKKKVSAQDLFKLIAKERVETGRIYIMNADHSNEHSPWTEQIVMSNLCTEILQPVTPLQSMDDPNGEIGICIIGAINVLECKTDYDLEVACDITVRLLDKLIDQQEYFNIAAENFAKKRRSLGIGVTNFAAYLAKHAVKYSDPEAVDMADELMEKIQYNLLKTSNKLAQEYGKCEKFHLTKYAQGIFPIDTYAKGLDAVVKRAPSQDWDSLRKLVAQYGLRNSTLSAIMPAESSSVIQNATNGIEPILNRLTFKSSKEKKLPMIAPGNKNWVYELAYDMQDNIGFMNIVGAFQKHTDMGISANTYYNYSHYEKNMLPDKKVIREILHAYKMGHKTMYYCKTDDGHKSSSVDNNEEAGCGGGCSV